MSHKNKNFDYGIDINLSASDIVNGAGPQYTIKEVEMESAIKEVLDECEKHSK